MFEDSTFESYGRIRTRSRKWMLATFALNGSILVLLILIPLIYPEALPKGMMSMLLVAPPPPPAAPPKAQPQQAAHPFHGTREFDGLHLTVPRVIPPTISKDTAPEQVPGGNDLISFGTPGGIPGGSDLFRSAPVHPAPAVPKPQGPAHISSGVAAGLLIQKVVPEYPSIARAARVEGTVVLEAVISRTGAIERLRVVSGPVMLQQAALNAVQQWRYRPYMLNGDPVDVETTINVVFTMNR